MSLGGRVGMDDESSDYLIGERDILTANTDIIIIIIIIIIMKA